MISEDELTPKQKKVAQELAGLYAFGGVIASQSDIYTGAVLLTKANERAEEVVRAFRNNKFVWGILVNLTESSALMAMIFGHGMMFYAILMHDGRIKRNDAILKQYGYTEQDILGDVSSAMADSVKG